MNKFLESKSGQRIQQKLRNVEKKRAPLWAKERDFYEEQEQRLGNPLTRDEYIQSLRQKAAILVPPQYLPEESLLMRYQTPESIFSSERQALYSDHNIAHHAIVAVGSLMGARYLQANYPDTYATLNEDALLKASVLHDTQRIGDKWESIPPFLKRHGRLGARRLPILMQAIHAENTDDATISHVAHIIRYHDIDKKQIGKEYTPELGIMVAADRAALERLFNSKDAMIRLTAGALVAKRMRRFKNGGIAANPEIFDMFSELLGALDIMTKEKLQQGADPKKQFKLVIDCAKELGIVSSR